MAQWRCLTCGVFFRTDNELRLHRPRGICAQILANPPPPVAAPAPAPPDAAALAPPAPAAPAPPAPAAPENGADP